MKDLINFYRVKDLEKTRQFYSDILNLSLYKDQGKCLIFDAEHGKLGFCSHFPEEISQSSCITFVYDSKESVDEMYIKLSMYAVHPPTENTVFKIYHFFITDPNGLKLEFQYFI